MTDAELRRALVSLVERTEERGRRLFCSPVVHVSDLRALLEVPEPCAECGGSGIVARRGRTHITCSACAGTVTRRAT